MARGKEYGLLHCVLLSHVHKTYIIVENATKHQCEVHGLGHNVYEHIENESKKILT